MTMQRLRVIAALALVLPALVHAAAAPVAAPVEKPAAAPMTPMPAPAPSAADVTRLPAPNAGEAEMRAQLEQVRALNAQLRQEREQLQQQLAKVQAEVVAEDKRLKQATVAAAQPAPVEESGSGLLLYAGAGLGALLLGVVVFVLRRKAAGKA